MKSVGGLASGALLLLVCMQADDVMAEVRYAAVKRLLYQQIFADHRRTLYCACAFDDARRLVPGSCGFSPPRNDERAKRVEVEHVVPASWIGQGHACWHRKICRDRTGRAFRGRACCLQTDRAFRRAYQDLHNLWPTVGTVNAARRHYAFAMIDGERRRFGACDFEVDEQLGLAEPRPAVRGDVARISLYMADRYGIALSAAQRTIFLHWHRSDPPDDAERQRNRRIQAYQGAGNTWVEGPPAAARNAVLSRPATAAPPAAPSSLHRPAGPRR
jgi:deoxyribonuclease-1